MADSLYNVFQKFCPQCASTLARSVDYCECGYSFAGADGEPNVLAQAVAEEKLYEDYLNARVSQTAQVAIAAQVAHKAHPRDASYAVAAQNALEAAEAARAELATQTAKLADLMRQLEHDTRNASADAAELSAPSQRRTPPAPTQPAPRILKPTLSVNAHAVTSAAQALQEELASLRAGNRAGTPARPMKAETPQVSAKGARTTPARTVPVVAPAIATAKTAGAEAHKTKDCPQCTATLASTREHCVCGYSFAAGKQPRAVRHADAADMRPLNEILDRARDVKKVKQQAAQAAKAEKIKQARLARQAAKAQREQQLAAEGAALAAGQAEVAAADAQRRQHEEDERALAERLAKAEAERGRAMALAQAQAEEAARQVAAAEQAAREAQEKRLAAEEAARRVIEEQTRAAKAAERARLDRERHEAQVRASMKDCPNCTSQLAKAARFCKCGYEFAEMTPFAMPALSLDPTDSAKVVDLTQRRR